MSGTVTHVDKVCLAQALERNLRLSAGKDYNHTLGRYEFVLFEDENIVARQTGFKSKKQAVAAGLKAAAALQENVA